jgi:hypothetical protein
MPLQNINKKSNAPWKKTGINKANIRLKIFDFPNFANAK